MAESSHPHESHVLRQAFKILTTNWELFLPFLVLSIIPSSLVPLANPLSIIPLLLNPFIYPFPTRLVIIECFPSQCSITHDIKLIMATALFIFIECLLSLVSITVIVHVVAMTYVEKRKALKESFSRIIRSWKAPLTTRLYITILDLAYSLLLASLAFLLTFVLESSLLNLFSLLAVVFSLVTYHYFRSVCFLGVVISVVEGDCYGGVSALKKAGEVARREGRPVFRAAAFMALTNCFVFGVYDVLSDGQAHAAMAIAMVIGEAILGMPAMAMHTVLYYECKKRLNEEGRVAKEGAAYAGLPGDSPANTHLR